MPRQFGFMVFGWVLAFLLPRASAELPPVLTRVAEIRNLPRAVAARGLPVRLRGTVIFKSRSGTAFNVHDGDLSIAVHRFRARDLKIWEGGDLPETESEPGAVVEIEGITGPGGYSPVIVPVRFHRVGTAPLPPARRVSMERLISGSEVSQRLEIEGVVQRATWTGDGKLTLDLMIEGLFCEVEFQQSEDIDPDQLMDARVQARGCSSPIFNFRSEATRMRLLAQNIGDLTVLRPPPPDPFQAPRVSLRQLLPFSPTPDRFHRKVTQGVVNFALPGQFFFLQDGATGVRVESSTATVQVGERVDVAGFVETTHSLASLSEAVVRPLGHADLPPAHVVSAKKLLLPSGPNLENPLAAVSHFGCLVRLPGIIRRIEWKRDGTPPTLFIGSDGSLFRASLPGSTLPSAPWTEGTEVEVTGVCELSFEAGEAGPKPPTVNGFSLWLRSPADVRVVRVPSWWTTRKLGFALVALLGVLLLTLGWAAALRRALQRRTERLAAVMRAHRDSELEFAAARGERQRLASDLHDGLQQLIAGAAYRMEVAFTFLENVPEDAREHFAAARRAMVRTQTGLRECLWGLRAVEEGSADFPALLEHAVGTMDHWPPGAVEVEARGASFPLSRHVMGSLLMLVQESVSNAFRHGHARRVTVAVEYHPAELTLHIEDDGRGFDPDDAPGTLHGHFGLESMRHRTKWLGGTVAISSIPGQPTRVEIRIPRSAAESSETPAAGASEDGGSPPPSA